MEISPEEVILEHPANEENGDYSTNIALRIKGLASGIKDQGEAAGKIAIELRKNGNLGEIVEKIEAAGQGFINFSLKPEVFIGEIGEIREKKETYGTGKTLAGKKIMIEYAHPNTHKEMHIGHMRTLITGEALARILTANGAEIFRANYQGDIGPHVAKAIFGTEKILAERKLSWDQAEKLPLPQKAHLLGEGYVRGVKESEENSKEKKKIDLLNKKLYDHDKSVWPIYERTRVWSLFYYDELYARFGTKFDRFYFESEVAGKGKKIVEENVGKTFEKSAGAIIFPGEKYGLHTRVFVTADGNPTYEGKEMALAQEQFADFHFDKNIHVVANEQKGYFQVVIKALELLNPEFTGREYHLSMGMVQLVGKKISSRTGVLITVDGLIEDVKTLLRQNFENVSDTVLEKVAVGAIKYSVLRTGPALNALFDLQKSVSLEGDSGPYLQYTYARAESVLRKADFQFSINFQSIFNDSILNLKTEERAVLRFLPRYPEVVEMAAKTYGPNVIATYLYELARRFNNFYNAAPIIGSGQAEQFRLTLTAATAQVIKNGLELLGVEAPERM